MASPTFVNAGTFSHVNAVSASPALPATRTNGNLLVVFCFINGNPSGVSGSGSGWTFGTLTDGTRNLVYGTRVVDGSEASPTISWSSGAQIMAAVVAQYSGCDTTSPVGATTSGFGSGTALTAGSITSTRSDSSAAAFLGFGTNAIPSNPSGFTSESSASGTFPSSAYRLSDVAIATSGSTSPSVSSTASSSNGWGVALIELKSPITGRTITGSQTIPAFGQSAVAVVEVAIAVSQTIPAFGQTGHLSSLPDRNAAADQTIPAFTQTATLETDTSVTVAQTIPAFGQSATLTVECVITVSQTILAFSQAAVLKRGDATPGLIFRGVIGGCSINRAGLATLEARSILTLGRGFLSERFCQQCRADLYDSRCKVVKESFSATATVASVPSQFKFTVTALPDARATGTWYDLGQAVITSGTGEGTPFQIKTWTSGTLTVEAMTPIDELLDVGDTLTLYAGCDKSSTTCRDKFANMINYRGEEYAAGRDLQLTTAGA